MLMAHWPSGRRLIGAVVYQGNSGQPPPRCKDTPCGKKATQVALRVQQLLRNGAEMLRRPEVDFMTMRTVKTAELFDYTNYATYTHRKVDKCPFLTDSCQGQCCTMSSAPPQLRVQPSSESRKQKFQHCF
eukprot:s1364_g2.t1